MCLARDGRSAGMQRWQDRFDNLAILWPAARFAAEEQWHCKPKSPRSLVLETYVQACQSIEIRVPCHGPPGFWGEDAVSSLAERSKRLMVYSI